MVISILLWLLYAWMFNCVWVFLLLSVDALRLRCTRGRRGISRQHSEMGFWADFFWWAVMPLTVGAMLFLCLLWVAIDLPYAGLCKLFGKEPRGLLLNPLRREDMDILADDDAAR